MKTKEEINAIEGIKLLNINKFIKENGSRKILTGKTFVKSKNGEFIPNTGSFYDPGIFGFSTKEKYDKFGYIELQEIIMHPFIYKNIIKVGTDFNKCINKKEKYIIKNGKLVPDKSGSNGINFIINNFNKINFEEYKTENNELFISLLTDTNKELLLINKIPVIPIGYRNYRFEHGLIEEDEITQLYKKIMSVIESKDWIQDISQEDKTAFDAVLQNIYQTTSKKEYLQRYVKNLFDYFIETLQGKSGFMVSGLIGKRLDNVARFVMNAQPDMPIDSCGIPWQGLLVIFDVFVASYLNKEEYKDISRKLKTQNKNIEELGDLFNYIYKNVAVYNKTFPEHQNLWISLLLQIFNDNPEIRVMIKRDPGWSENSFWVLKPLIISGEAYNIIMPSFVYKPLGGDSFYSGSIFHTFKDTAIDKTDEYLITNKTNTKNRFISSSYLYGLFSKKIKLNEINKSIYYSDHSEIDDSLDSWEDFVIKGNIKKLDWE